MPSTGLFLFIGPCRAAWQAGVAAQAQHAPPGSGQHGYGGHRAVPGLGRAKKTCFRAGCRAAGCMDIYNLTSLSLESSNLLVYY